MGNSSDNPAHAYSRSSTSGAAGRCLFLSRLGFSHSGCAGLLSRPGGRQLLSSDGPGPVERWVGHMEIIGRRAVFGGAAGLVVPGKCRQLSFRGCRFLAALGADVIAIRQWGPAVVAEVQGWRSVEWGDMGWVFYIRKKCLAI